MNKTIFFITSVVLLSLFISPAGMYADPITELNYQGRILADSSFFNNTGDFKFIITNSAGNTTYWSNDGSSTGGGEPTDAVALSVKDGLYSLILGDPSFNNMTTIPVSIFDNGNNLYLGVWFNDGVNGSQHLSPNEKIVSAAYAVNADRVDGLEDLDIVQTSGVQTIDGEKTFTSFPVGPSTPPSSDYQIANKKYVDDEITTVTYTGGDGIDIDGANVISADLSSGGGLKIVTAELAVEVGDFAGSGLEDDGSDDLRISSAAAGDGLAGGGGSALAVNAGSGIEIASDAVAVDLAATNPGLEFSGGDLKARVDNDTMEIGASGLRVRRDYAYREERYVVKAGGTIGLDCDYTDIQTAVAALGSGGSIYVKSGTYNINSGNRIQVTADNVELVFEGGARMVATANTTPLTISGDYDRVSGVYVDMDGHSGTAIAIANANYCRVEDGRTLGGSEGVGFYESTSCGVTEMDVSGAEAGIVIYGSSYSNASGNKIMECTEGIRFGKESRFNTVEANFIFECGKFGVVLYSDTSENTVLDNQIISIRDGYGIFSSANLTRVISNRISKTRRESIYFEKVRNGSICSNTCQYNGSNGIFLDEGSAQCLISGNRCYHNDGNGIRVEGEQNNIASNHTMYNGSVGIYLTASSRNNGVMANRTDTLTDSGTGNTPTGPAGLTQTDVNRVGP